MESSTLLGYCLSVVPSPPILPCASRAATSLPSGPLAIHALNRELCSEARGADGDVPNGPARSKRAVGRSCREVGFCDFERGGCALAAGDLHGRALGTEAAGAGRACQEEGHGGDAGVLRPLHGA